jgi:cysteine synthase
MIATVLDTIGNTTLVPLRHIVPKGSAKIFIKLEGENPTGPNGSAPIRPWSPWPSIQA